jgi:hypothetical protein
MVAMMAVQLASKEQQLDELLMVLVFALALKMVLLMAVKLVVMLA